MVNGDTSMQILNDIGFVRYVTPKGRETWVNPAFEVTPEFLVETDDYHDFLDAHPEVEDDRYDMANGDY